MAMTNTEIAERLGMSHSSVSRMRAGLRVASIETLHRLVTEFGADAEEVLAAASEASHGQPGRWTALLESIFDDQPADVRV